ncbi:hypothetical protein BDZ94DRAFT_399636 [Collybia nuda]|uniref:Uncharacterized protein n=1 Tax=Collybia nuda TaxID=64659 RepID=A0A9P5XVQ2_9AGAR|nr:hypothetical protein BDZ94DRAFT_399636 [Collybia nuda]
MQAIFDHTIHKKRGCKGTTPFPYALGFLAHWLSHALAILHITLHSTQLYNTHLALLTVVGTVNIVFETLPMFSDRNQSLSSQTVSDVAGL